jgi:uncharacterized Tic20 family protein
MLFIFLFVLGALTVPLIIDINKNGSNNIIFKSGQEILKFPVLQSVFKSLNIASDKVNVAGKNLNSAITVAIFLCLCGLIIYLIFQVLSFILFLIFG